MSTPPDTTKSDLYSELGVDPRSTEVEIRSRIEEERERSNLLKKIPKRRSEAESRLAHLAEIEHVLLNPSARAAYDARPKAAEQSASAMSAPERLSTSATGLKLDVENAHFCTSCGAALSDGARFCEECATPILAHDATPRDRAPKVPDVLLTDRIGDDKAAVVSTKSVAEIPETTAPILVSPGTRTIKSPPTGPSPFNIVVPLVLIAVLSAVWFFNSKTASPVAVPPAPGQVADLRSPGNAELKTPTSSRRSSDPSRSGADDLETTVQRDPRAARRLNTQGLQALVGPHRDLNEAKRLFQKAVQLDPELVEALNNLGDVCGILEDYRTSEAILTKVLTMAPKRRVAHGNLGYVEAKLGNIDQAEFHFCEYIRAFDNFDKGTSKLKGSFTDPDPHVQTAVNLTIANCKP
ncbi:MAG: zinc-ribbon domain-containing protein [Candidatus Sulfotelmatobacter sp.]